MSDPVVRVLLAVIAVALTVLALRSVPVAQAVDAVECRVEGPIQIRGPVEVRITDLPSSIQVETTPRYGSAGSSSGNPLYIRNTQ